LRGKTNPTKDAETKKELEQKAPQDRTPINLEKLRK
jgi:hypothetical protein